MAVVSPDTALVRDRFTAAPDGRRSDRSRTRGIVPLGLLSVVGYVGTAAFGVDTLYALYTGRIVTRGGPPDREVLTTAAHATWTDQQWLGQWLFFEAERLTGYAGITLLCILCLTLAGLLLARLIEASGGSLPTMWAGLAVLGVVFATAAARTQTLVLPLFVALLWLLTAQSRRTTWHRSTLLIVPVLALWANLHGSVLLGVALAVVGLTCQASRLLLRSHKRAAVATGVTALACAATPLATPYGWSSVHYYSSLMSNHVLRSYVSDWKATSPTHVAAWPFILLSLAAAATLTVGLRRRRLPRWKSDVAVAVGFTALGFYTARYVVWAVIVLAYVGAVHGRRLAVRLPRRPTTIARVLGISLLAVGLLALATTPATNFTNILPNRVASAAVAALDTHPGAVALTDQTTSATLLWLHPQTARRVAFDIRYEQYRAVDLTAYMQFLEARNLTLACRYGVVAVSTKERPKLVATIKSDPAWTATYDGSDGVVAVRTPGTTCPR